METVRRRSIDRLVFGAILVFVVAAVIRAEPRSVLATMGDRVTTGFGFMLTASSLALVALLFGLEYAFPAREEERRFTPSMVLDAFYLLVQLPIVAVTVTLLAQPVGSWIADHLSFLVLDTTRTLPWPVVLILGIAISDLGLWFSHLVRHKVPFLWRFHMIHHSQTRLSLFTASRDHPLDSLFETFLRVLPVVALFPSIVENAQALALYGLLVSWHIRFTHTNIRTNLGPLRYVLVTPQSHRIHHSTRPEHWNSNYANVFCWDRLFGLQHPDDRSYPPTGVNDPVFPEPRSLSPIELMRAYGRQLAFPFDADAVRRATLAPPEGDGDLPSAAGIDGLPA